MDGDLFTPAPPRCEAHKQRLPCFQCTVEAQRAQAVDGGDRDGETYSPGRDRARLGTQAGRVFSALHDGEWHTLASLSADAGAPEASISARIRDLRKARFGGHTVERRDDGCGLWQYRLIVKPIERR